MRARQRSHRRRIANSSFTETEKRFYRPIIRIAPKTGRIIYVEGFDEHIQRMRNEAADERIHPRESYRIIARIQQVPSIKELPLNHDERELIRRKLIRDNKGRVLLDPQFTIHDVEKSILRYRRLTGRDGTPAF
jgi:hypothetical protein